MSQFDELFDTTDEAAILSADKGFSGTKIEASGIFLCAIKMAKQVDSKSSASRNFKLELETEKGAKLYWDAGWYIGKSGTNLDSKGKLLSSAASLVRLNSMLTGSKDLPTLSPARINEYDWELKREVEVDRVVARELVGKFIKVQVVRKRVNKQVNSGRKGPDGYDIWVDGPEERFINEVKRFYMADTDKTFGEHLMAKEATDIVKDAEYCAKTPVLDKYKAVAAPVAAAAGTGGSSTTGFGS